LVFPVEPPIIMRRSIVLSGCLLFGSICTPPLAAQQATGNLADQYAKEAKEQVSRAKRYSSAPSSKGYMSAPRPRANYGSIDSTGRLDMSGRVPPSYFKSRDQSSPLSSRAYAPTVSRTRAPRAKYTPKSVPAPSARVGGRSALEAIPPAPR
jgi:hypothetical protein